MELRSRSFADLNILFERFVVLQGEWGEPLRVSAEGLLELVQGLVIA